MCSTIMDPNETNLATKVNNTVRCKIYLSGFTEHDQEQLRKVLKFAGATRFVNLKVKK